MSPSTVHSLGSNADAALHGEGTPRQDTNQPAPGVLKRSEPHSVVADDTVF